MDWRITLDGEPPRGGFTWKEVLAVIVVLGVLIALLLPAVSTSREAPRRIQCRNNLKRIGLAIHNYAQANKVFPPGTICGTEPIPPGNQYDVWAEAAQTGPGFHGTSFLLRIKPYVEGNSIAETWNCSEGICSKKIRHREKNNFEVASKDFSKHYLPSLYCPTRRNEIRPQDKTMMLSPSWTGGGTDYGGCAGRHAAFTFKTGYNLCDASTFYEPNFYPEPFTAENDPEKKRWGIFGRVNVSTTFAAIRDGTSSTIMTGELQRITDITPGSKDGWAIGGPATLFTTGAMVRYDGSKLEFVAQPGEGKLMNNNFFGSPGSEHVGGAHFGMADGSVRWISDSMDPRVFALMGSMADGVEEVSSAP